MDGSGFTTDDIMLDVCSQLKVCGVRRGQGSKVRRSWGGGGGEGGDGPFGPARGRVFGPPPT